VVTKGRSPLEGRKGVQKKKGAVVRKRKRYTGGSGGGQTIKTKGLKTGKVGGKAPPKSAQRINPRTGSK